MGPSCQTASVVTVTFSLDAVTVSAVKKALYRCADKGSFEIDVDSGSVHVRLYPSAGIEMDQLSAAVRTEILDQDLREIVAGETAEQRTLILANAFSKTTLIG